MPTAPTYPGVYIEEIPSGVRTITGVPTAVTALIGRALRGPADEPVVINSYGDFERIFGGLWLESALGFAVRDFYVNAPGGQAVIVRLAPSAVNSQIDIDADAAASLPLQARYPGAWGNRLRARIDWDTADPADTKQFNLTIAEVEGGTATTAGTVLAIERIRNLSVDTNSTRRIDRVLSGPSNESRLVRWPKDSSGADVAYPSPEPARPKKSEDPVAGDPFASPAVPAKPVWGDNDTSAKSDGSGTDGNALGAADFVGPGKEANKKGLFALENTDIFNLLCIPPYKDGDIESSLIDPAIAYCEKKRAFMILDPPKGWIDKDTARTGMNGSAIGTPHKNAAIFFPRLRQPNPLREDRIEAFAPCGTVAGVFARTDGERGVWKAPAGLDATLRGVPDLSAPLTDPENGELNPLGLNCLRIFPGSLRVVWGSRTRVGSDRMASEWKYIPVRRLALFLEESLYRGTQWAVFEPNDEPLWAALRLNIGAFMHNLFRQGAFQGREPREAYFVRCDSTTTTQNDINLGIVNVLIGFAPLKPAEFVILKFQQMAGQIEA